MIKLFSLAAIIVLFASVSNAQNEILLLNGKTISALNYSFDSSLNLLQYEIQKGKKSKMILIESNEVFSVTDINRKEYVLYAPEDNDQFSTLEMRMVLQGESAAYNNYKPVWPFIVGFASGFSSMLLPVNPMLGLTVPIAYNIGIAFYRPCDAHISKKYPQQASDELFAYGYKQKGANTVLKRSIFGTGTGIAAGIATALIISLLQK